MPRNCHEDLLFNGGEPEEGFSDDHSIESFIVDDDVDEEYHYDDDDDEDDDGVLITARGRASNFFIDDEAVEDELEDEEPVISEESSGDCDLDDITQDDFRLHGYVSLDDALSESLSTRLENWFRSLVREERKYIKRLLKKDTSEELKSIFRQASTDLKTLVEKVNGLKTSQLIDPNTNGNGNRTVGLEYKYRYEAYKNLIANYKRRFDEKFEQHLAENETLTQKAREKEQKYKELKNAHKSIRILMHRFVAFHQEEMEDLDGIMHNAKDISLDKLLSARIRLHEVENSQPSETLRPSTELDKLMAENKRIRSENKDLYFQVQELKRSHLQNNGKSEEPEAKRGLVDSESGSHSVSSKKLKV